MRQGDPKGLGHAVLRAKAHVSDQSFAVLLGDDMIDERDELLPKMIEVQNKHQAHVVALMEVPEEQIHLYGCAAVEKTADDSVVKITGLVEKPSIDQAPSNLAVIGRYVLKSKIFETLENTAPGRGNEIQLTDALAHEAENDKVFGVIFAGRRYDTGDKLDYLKSTLRVAIDREDIGEDLREWLKDFSKGL
jgi:UTP--glucose-1-phosphate uridylyltransferase